MNQPPFLYYLISCCLFVLLSAVGYVLSTLMTGNIFTTPYEYSEYYPITEEVTADTAIIYSLSDERIIAGKNIKKQKPIASITKLIAAAAGYPKLNDIDSTTLLSDDFTVTANTSLRVGETWGTIDLLNYSLITSSNRGIQGVARTIKEKTGSSLVDLMNSFADEHSLVQTYFINPTGLDVHGTLAGAESSAFDLAKIAGIVLGNDSDVAGLTTQAKKQFYLQNGVRHDAKNTNILIGDIPDFVLLSKTGNTDLAGSTLIMVTDYNGQHIAFVVLDSTPSGRFEDMRRLLLLYKEILDKDIPTDM